MSQIKIHYDSARHVDSYVEFENKTLSLGWNGLNINYITTATYAIGANPELLDISSYKIESRAHAEAIIAALESALRENLIK